MSVSVPLYVNIQGTAGHIHPDVFSGDLSQQRQHSYHRAGTGAAGIGEVLHPPLIGALIYMVRADDLVKIHVSALGEILIEPQLTTQPEQCLRVEILQILHGHCRMWDAGVSQLHIGAIIGRAVHLRLAIQAHVAGIVEPHTVQPAIHSPTSDQTRRGLHLLHLAGQSVFIAISADAAGTVAAHLPHGAIGIEKQHLVVAAVGRLFHHHESVGTDGHMPLTDSADDLRPLLIGYSILSVIHHNKVVAGTVHFPKLHGVTPSFLLVIALYMSSISLSNFCHSPVFRMCRPKIRTIAHILWHFPTKR